MRASGVFNEMTSVLMHVTEIFVMGYIPIELCYEYIFVCSEFWLDWNPTPPINAPRRRRTQPKSFRKSRWCRKTSSVRSWCVYVYCIVRRRGGGREESSLAINEKIIIAEEEEAFSRKCPSPSPAPSGFFNFFFFCVSRLFFSSESAKVCFAQSVATAADQCGIGSQCKPWFVA